MASKLRIFTKRFFIFANVLVVILFLLACLAPYLNPQKWWFISFLGIGFPFLLAFVILFMIMWLFIARKLALLSFITLLLGYKAISVFYSFNVPRSFSNEKQPGTIRIATWNVARFIEMKRNNNKGSQTRLRMLEQIQEQNADVLCLQEFFDSYAPDYYHNIYYISKRLGYPYYVFSHDEDGDRHYTGSVIFSRFPIIDSGLLRYPRPTLPEALVHADIRVNEDTIRIFTSHLQSIQFDQDDWNRISSIKEGEEGMVSNSRTIFSKLKTGMSFRKIQADIIEQVTGDSPYPVVFCGDLNDIPNSYTYFKVRGHRQDAFLKKGSGIGRTFSALSPTLRIDYIFADPQFRVDQFDRILRKYSDHYMLVADLSYAR